MDIAKYPIGFQQIFKLSKFFFSSKNFRLLVVLSKTPFLSGGIAALGAQKETGTELSSGTCLLIPESSNGTKWQHIVIERVEYMYGQKMYYYNYRKPRARKHNYGSNDFDIDLKAKPAEFIKQYGVINHYADCESWLGKRDIDSSVMDRVNYHTTKYPLIVSEKAKFIEWFNKELHIPYCENSTLSSISKVVVNDSIYSGVNIVSPYSVGQVNEPSIWINRVPSTALEGNAIVILSPYLSTFEEKIIQIGDLYQESRLIASSLDELPLELRSLLKEKECYKFSLLSKGLS